MPIFRYERDIIEKYPTVVGGVIHAQSVTNGPATSPLAAAYSAEQVQVRERIGDQPLSEIPSLAAWRGVFRGFGVNPTKYRSAAEALLRRLNKQGDIPSNNAHVDLANLVSIRYALPVAVFDRRDVVGGTVVRLARGDEAWADLGGSESEHPEAGEVIFADDADNVSARRWCWRQSRQSAAGPSTTEILVTVEGHHDDARADVAAALDDLRALVEEHASPASMRSAIVTAEAPAFE
jgi:DNA/RNA-binding domain of Phe-tRNA-synthetase-like protein